MRLPKPRRNCLIRIVGGLDKEVAHHGKRAGGNYQLTTHEGSILHFLGSRGVFLERSCSGKRAGERYAFHNHDSRDGLYVDSAFTQGAAANLARDMNFDGTIEGVVYAQPLYLDNGPGGRATIIAVTELNNVYALDALDGSVIWERNVGPPVSAGDLCNPKFDPVGVTGTPVVDLASRALFLDAMTTPDGGETIKHLILSLNVDTGDINRLARGRGGDSLIQRDQLHRGDPTAATRPRHREQHSLCWLWEHERWL
jgi:hypothetical protein